MNPDLHHKALPKGDRLHWYRIDSILGQGGFGITYLAEDTNLEQRVAIKEYLPNELAVRANDTTVQPISEDHNKMYRWGLDRFLKEAKILARFKHPNIVRVRSFFEQHNTAYMVMEYEEGESLASVIKAGRLRGEAALMALLDPILDGLELIHREGFIHRDIKPDNIFIRADGSPVLLDFGSARHALSGHTRTLTSLVTPGYAPFEQYHDGEGKQGPWTDIYALGATCYRAITGRTPVEAIKRGMARIDHATDPYVPLADLELDGYSAPILDAIDCALRFLESDRPQSAASWQRMLRGAAPVPPESALPGAAQPPASGGDTRRQTVPTLDVDLGTPAAPTLAPKTPGPVDAATLRTGPAAAHSPPVRRGWWWGGLAGAAAVVLVGAALLPRLQTPPTPLPATAPMSHGVTVDGQLADAAQALARGQREVAAAAYRAVLALEPDNATALHGIDTLVETELAAANQALAAGDLDLAHSHLALAEGLAAEDGLGIRLVREKLARARAGSERLAALLVRARSELRAGRAAQALADFEGALALAPDNDAAREGRAEAQRALEQQRRGQAATAQRRRVSELLAAARADASAGRLSGARARYQELLALDSEHAQARAEFAEVQARLAAQAQAHERQAHIATLLRSARRALDARRLRQAREEFSQVLELEPDNQAAKRGLARLRAVLARPQTPASDTRTVASPTRPYRLAILPWTLRGTENYEPTIFAGLEQALAERAPGVELSHSYYREFDAARGSAAPTTGNVSNADLARVWIQQGLFAHAELDERQSRTIANRLGADAALLASISVAAENARIELYLFDERGGRTRRVAGELHFPMWGYDPDTARKVRDLFLRVLPPRS